MSVSWLALAQEQQNWLTSLRHDLHRHPERGNAENYTTALIERELHALGIETARCTPTGTVGILRGALSGPVAALRADIDALPVTEDTAAEFSSCTPGMMHACGHDVHTAAALGAARLLASQRDRLPGTVKFLFQPNEEEDGGAWRMIEGGCLKDPAVQAVFGAHVAPDLPLGQVGVRFGKFYAASDIFDVTVRGKSAHGAQPEKGIDALFAAACMAAALKRLPESFPTEKTVVTVGSLHAGQVRNVIADIAQFSGIIRTLGPDSRRIMRQRFEQTLRQISQECGTTLEILVRESYPGIVNSDNMTHLAQAALGELFGQSNVHTITEPTMTSEDFGFFTQAAQGSFYHIGVGGDHPLHSKHFLPPDEAVPLAAAAHAAVLWRYLHEPEAFD